MIVFKARGCTLPKGDEKQDRFFLPAIMHSKRVREVVERTRNRNTPATLTNASISESSKRAFDSRLFAPFFICRMAFSMDPRNVGGRQVILESMLLHRAALKAIAERKKPHTASADGVKPLRSPAQRRQRQMRSTAYDEWEQLQTERDNAADDARELRSLLSRAHSPDCSLSRAHPVVRGLVQRRPAWSKWLVRPSRSSRFPLPLL